MGSVLDVCCPPDTDTTPTSPPRGGHYVEENPEGSQSCEPPGERIRLFIVGTAEVGKSTLIKQIQKLCMTTKGYEMFDDGWEYKVPFTEEVCMAAKPKIYQNIFRIIGTLIIKAKHLGLRFDNPTHEQYADEIMQYINCDLGELFQKTDLVLTPDMAHKIHTLRDEDCGAIGGAWHRRKDFLVSDSADYFLEWDKLQEVSKPNYKPSVDDLLRVRDPTTGMHDYNFRLHRVKFTFRDVGGQPMERERWLTYLQGWLRQSRPTDKNFILFVAALSDYNQRHPTYRDQTKLGESMELVRHLLNLRDLEDCSFILFLNKRDIFQHRIVTYNDFNEYFYEYVQHMDRRLTLSQAERIVASKFADTVAHSNRPDEQFYCRFTTAIDTGLMSGIFGAVRADIIENMIRHGNWDPFP